MDPSTGQKNASSFVRVLLNMAGVDANLQKGTKYTGSFEHQKARRKY